MLFLLSVNCLFCLIDFFRFRIVVFKVNALCIKGHYEKQSHFHSRRSLYWSHSFEFFFFSFTCFLVHSLFTDDLSEKTLCSVFLRISSKLFQSWEFCMFFWNDGFENFTFFFESWFQRFKKHPKSLSQSEQSQSFATRLTFTSLVMPFTFELSVIIIWQNFPSISSQVYPNFNIYLFFFKQNSWCVKLFFSRIDLGYNSMVSLSGYFTQLSNLVSFLVTLVGCLLAQTPWKYLDGNLFQSIPDDVFSGQTMLRYLDNLTLSLFF